MFELLASGPDLCFMMILVGVEKSSVVIKGKLGHAMRKRQGPNFSISYFDV